MKSGTFGHNYVFSGSDNFAIYAWKMPDFAQNPEFQYVKRADFVLQGHNSIVNQVRFNPIFNTLATSGVEKRIKLWSPFDIGLKNSQENCENNVHRRISRAENRFQLYAQSTELSNDDFDIESTEENPKMLAFFDTLVQRDFSSDSEETLSETESDDIQSVIAKKRIKRTQSRLSSQDSEYIENTIQTARNVLNQSPENILNDSNTVSEIDSEVERAILDLDHSSDEEKSEQKSVENTKSDTESSDSDAQESIQNNNSRHLFKKGKTGKVRCYRSNK